MKPHKHAELIKAWADGHTVQYKDGYGWWDWDYPDWDGDDEYRIKPESTPAVTCYLDVTKDDIFYTDESGANLKVIIDGETGELKSAEVLK